MGPLPDGVRSESICLGSREYRPRPVGSRVVSIRPLHLAAGSAARRCNFLNSLTSLPFLPCNWSKPSVCVCPFVMSSATSFPRRDLAGDGCFAPSSSRRADPVVAFSGSFTLACRIAGFYDLSSSCSPFACMHPAIRMATSHTWPQDSGLLNFALPHKERKWTYFPVQ